MRNWPAWTRYIAGHSRTPFAYDAAGIDCGRFAAGAIEALTGRNPLGRLAWKNATGARMQIARLGKGAGFEAAVSALLTPIPPAHAHRGDIAGVADDALGVRLMVIEGATLVGPGDQGQRRQPRSAMIMAWSAGDA